MPSAVEYEQEFEIVSELSKNDPEAAVKRYTAIIESEGDDQEIVKIKENSIYNLGKLFAQLGKGKELEELLKAIRPFFQTIPKAKTEKIVWTLIGNVAQIPDSLNLQIDLCKESIAWSKTEKRTFLRHKIETKLSELLLQACQYTEALEIINPLLREVKRLDDKALLVEIHLVESKVQHSLKNLPRARAALTAARTAANSIYCPPLLQGRIDMQSGTLHTEEKDYKTGYSYFYEAFEGYNSLDRPEAIVALKYMLLCKIMTNNPDDVHSILSGKLALTYAGSDVDAMRAIANAHKDRSLASFQKHLSTFEKELKDDPLINNHLNELYDTMLQQNLCRIIEPFSSVEISHVANLIKLDVTVVEKKLSQMILDAKFNGILDQGNGLVILFPDPPEEKTYQTTLETLDNLGNVVDTLYQRAQKLN